MNDMDLVEHVARQLCTAEGYNPDLVGKSGNPRWWLFVSTATHVLPLLANAWHEGLKEGIDLGLSIAETQKGIKSPPFPTAPPNPYRQEETNE